jgi:pyridoxamine 5'-phosphate oxidase
MVKSLRLLVLYAIKPAGAYTILTAHFNPSFRGIEPYFQRTRSALSSFSSFLCSKQISTSVSRFMKTSSYKNDESDVNSWTNNVGQADIGLKTISHMQKEEDSALETDVLAENMVDDRIQTVKVWRKHLEVSIARSRKIRGSNYVQLATIDTQSNEPRCRTVVFRGFLNLPEDHSLCQSVEEVVDDVHGNRKLPCIMKMCTDRRSEKVHQTGPAELVWWFPKSSEQFRVRGEMTLIGNDDSPKSQDCHLLLARKEMWGSLTDASRESFLTLARPGEVFEPTVSDPNRLMGGRDQDGKVIQPPPDSFLLMLLVPKRCDYLNLTTMYRQIDSIVDGQWQSQRVNP